MVTFMFAGYIKTSNVGVLISKLLTETPYMARFHMDRTLVGVPKDRLAIEAQMKIRSPPLGVLYLWVGVPHTKLSILRDSLRVMNRDFDVEGELYLIVLYWDKYNTNTNVWRVKECIQYYALPNEIDRDLWEFELNQRLTPLMTTIPREEARERILLRLQEPLQEKEMQFLDEFVEKHFK
jgi:hypothetical protein